MDIVVFGAAGPSGLLLCDQALSAGHTVRAVSRRAQDFARTHPRLSVVRADATSADGVREAVAGTDAVLSTLGAPFGVRRVEVCSAGTRHIVEAMLATGSGRRLVVVSAGLTYLPPRDQFGRFTRGVLIPMLRRVLGRNLYADMRRMEEYLHGCTDIDWTVMRPARLTKDSTVSAYRLDEGFPSQGRTARGDLAAAMLAELGPDGHVHRAMAPSTR